MKKILYLTVLVFTLFSCKLRTSYPKFDFDNGPNSALNAFKDHVFLAILRECFKGTNAMQELQKLDVGNPYDGIYDLKLSTKIDSIGKAFAEKIPPPMLCDECKTGQNYFIAQALHYYRSRELDSIAVTELKKTFPLEVKHIRPYQR